MDHDPVLDTARATGEPFEVVDCDPDLADTAQFCAAYGYSPAQSANLLVVVGKADPKVYAACLVLATTRLDVNGVVRKRLGTRRASFAPAEETLALTGMHLGGVTPYGLSDDLPLWIDARIPRLDGVDEPFDRVIVGGGSRDRKLLVPPASLLALPNAEVIDGLANDIVTE